MVLTPTVFKEKQDPAGHSPLPQTPPRNAQQGQGILTIRNPAGSWDTQVRTQPATCDHLSGCGEWEQLSRKAQVPPWDGGKGPGRHDRTGVASTGGYLECPRTCRATVSTASPLRHRLVLRQKTEAPLWPGLVPRTSCGGERSGKTLKSRYDTSRQPLCELAKKIQHRKVPFRLTTAARGRESDDDKSRVMIGRPPEEPAAGCRKWYRQRDWPRGSRYATDTRRSVLGGSAKKVRMEIAVTLLAWSARKHWVQVHAIPVVVGQRRRSSARALGNACSTAASGLTQPVRRGGRCKERICRRGGRRLFETDNANT
ncbi:hypothetical protein Q5P01_000345 [Channa striata]|uniref:Uncharacterized protein n=1 Tax=Channa striata TaxID=64152 RepID=A0AA88LN15_CHASR|nr:hypothetical protein Q5P01_000345 [Channa striata]